MSKELEALERIGKLETIGLRVVPTKTIVKDFADYEIIETALKQYNAIMEQKEDIINNNRALEIIKEKRVNVRALVKSFYSSCGLQQYNDTQCHDKNEKLDSKELTQEEYDLLKEVLV